MTTIGAIMDDTTGATQPVSNLSAQHKSSSVNTTRTSQPVPSSLTRHNSVSADNTGTTQPVLNWSQRHKSILDDTEPKLADKWITKNAAQMSDEITALVRRAFRDAFHAGAGANQKLNELGQ